MADLFPFAVYDQKTDTAVHIGLYEDRADCWRVFLGWPDQEEIEDAKKRGLIVRSITFTYDKPEGMRS